MPDINQAGAEVGLIDGVTNNVEVQLDNINGLTMKIREFCDGVMGPAPSQPPSQPVGSGLTGPETRGSKLIKSTERLSNSVRDLGDQVMRLRRI